MCKILPLQHVTNIQKWMRLFTFFDTESEPKVCILHLQHISISTGHISREKCAPGDSSYHAVQHSYRLLKRRLEIQVVSGLQ